MPNTERAIWSVISVWGKAWCALARSEIDKDRNLLIAFQVYISENNKVKWNKSRLPWLIDSKSDESDMIVIDCK